MNIIIIVLLGVTIVLILISLLRKSSDNSSEIVKNLEKMSERLVRVDGMHTKRHARTLEQLAAPRRTAGQHDIQPVVHVLPDSIVI